MITETIKGILLTNYCRFNGMIGKPIKEIVGLSRLEMIAYLEDDHKDLKDLELDIASEQEETIVFLKSISDEEYQEVKESLVTIEE